MKEGKEERESPSSFCSSLSRRSVIMGGIFFFSGSSMLHLHRPWTVIWIADAQSRVGTSSTEERTG